MKVQQHKLNQKLRGHDAYYGVTDNYRMLWGCNISSVKVAIATSAQAASCDGA